MERVSEEKKHRINRQAEYQLPTSISIDVNAYCAFSECYYLTNHIFTHLLFHFYLVKAPLFCF